MKKLVIIPGGFHPFHAGHKALYDAAVQAFPSAEVYIAATADTSARPFPIEAKKKLARLAGIPQNRFIQVKSPFQAQEIKDHYDPDNTVLIFARSTKDQDNQPKPGGTKKDGTLSYLQPFKRNGLEPMKRHAYMVYLPTVQFGPGMSSATEIRAKWPSMSPDQKINLINQLYPETQNNQQLTNVVTRLFDQTMDPAPDTETPLKEVDVGGASDAQFYAELLAVMAAVASPFVIGAFNKAHDIIKMYQANKIMRALEGKGVKNLTPEDQQTLQQLINQFKKAAANKQGDQAKQIAMAIHQTAQDRGVDESRDYIEEKQDACYHKVKSRYKVWPSAYASGALVQCRKKGAANWGTGGKKK